MISRANLKILTLFVMLAIIGSFHQVLGNNAFSLQDEFAPDEAPMFRPVAKRSLCNTWGGCGGFYQKRSYEAYRPRLIGVELAPASRYQQQQYPGYTAYAAASSGSDNVPQYYLQYQDNGASKVRRPLKSLRDLFIERNASYQQQRFYPNPSMLDHGDEYGSSDY